MKKLIQIGNIIDSVLRTCRRETNEELFKVWDIWESIVGEFIAENAKPAAFKKDILLVHVTGPIWIQQLQFFKKNIIININKMLGKVLVGDIKFVVGTL